MYDSPKYYFMLKNYNKARKILWEMSKEIVGEEYTAIFVEETQDENIVLS